MATLRKYTLCSPERCMNRNATSTEFLEIQIPLCVLVYDWDPVSSARSAQTIGEKNNNKKNKNMKR